MQEQVAPSTEPTQAKPSRALIWPFAIFCVLALLFALALQQGDPSRLPSALIGRPAPQLSLQPVEGLTDGVHAIGAFTRADLAAGVPTVVNFWASWCGPCVAEHPQLIALKQKTGVRLYGVNYKDQAAAARRFLGRYGNPFAAVGADATGRTAIDWGVSGMPETFVLNGKGEIVYKHFGPISAESLEAQVIPAIRAAQAH